MHGRLSGRTLQGIGATLMIVALAGALSTGAWADADFLAPMRLVVAQLVPAPSSAPGTPAPSPVASGPPGPTPTPRVYAIPRGGRLRVNLTGSLTFGSRSSTQTFSTGGSNLFGPSPSASPSPAGSVTSSESSSQGGVGMQAEITRRTATTSFTMRLPFGFSTGSKTQFGQINLLFSAPKYAVGYGGTAMSVLGQLPTGSTFRGGYLIVPAPGGDLTIADGPTVGAQGEIVPLQSMRYRGIHGTEIYEAAFARAIGALTGRSSTALFGAATARGKLTAVGEIAFQRRPGGDASPTTPSYQFRIDEGGLQSYVTAIHRHLAAGYLSYGAGESFGDDYTDLGVRRSGTTAFTLDSSVEKFGNTQPGQYAKTRITSASFGGPYRIGSYSLGVSSTSTSNSDGPNQWLGSASAQATASLGAGSLLLSSAFSRQTLDQGTPSATVSLTSSYQLPFHAYSLGFSLAALRQLQAAGDAAAVTESLNISRQYRRTGYGLQQTFTRNFSAISNAIQKNTQLYISRQISPVINIQVGYTLQSISDRLNPAANGKGSSFSVQVNAPFSFGNGLVSGREDPRLPATVVGRVLADVSSNPLFAGYVSNGINNVQVVLDDKYVQRTDLTGSFQFSFVSAGQHQIRVETASLPRGLTVDIPVYTLNVLGGQTAQISFLVGNFGGIQGHVYGRDDHGIIVPLPNVQLRVDGGVYSQTDETGAYGFGRLKPGKHEVDVIENSVPAFATFDSANAKATVEVRNGVYTPLDFSAVPLGSIDGTVVYDKDVDQLAGLGVANAYVVAEPGEHAAIVNDDGSYVIDNLPPGDYTVSVDPETIPTEGLGAGPESLAVTLASQEHYKGAAFVVGHMHKKVVFSFTGGSQSAPASLPRVRLSEGRLPPRGTSSITVDAPSSAKEVSAYAFGETFNLIFNEKRGAWIGELVVPTNAKAGPYTVTAKAENGTQPESTSIVVDAKMPVALLQMNTPNPVRGQYINVRARFLVDVREGDRIQWEDGQITTLGRPLAGRVFTFSLRYSLRPLHGLLLTKGSSLPISLM